MNNSYYSREYSVTFISYANDMTVMLRSVEKSWSARFLLLTVGNTDE